MDAARLDALGFGRRLLTGITSGALAMRAISASNSFFVISLNALFCKSFFVSCKRPMSPNISRIVLAAELFACAGASLFSHISRSVFRANSLSVSTLIVSYSPELKNLCAFLNASISRPLSTPRASLLKPSGASMPALKRFVMRAPHDLAFRFGFAHGVPNGGRNATVRFASRLASYRVPSTALAGTLRHGHALHAPATFAEIAKRRSPRKHGFGRALPRLFRVARSLGAP